MVDVYNGRFPSNRPNPLLTSKDEANLEQEERRLLYVGITRAKNNLYLFKIKKFPSDFIDEIFSDMGSRNSQPICKTSSVKQDKIQASSFDGIVQKEQRQEISRPKESQNEDNDEQETERKGELEKWFRCEEVSQKSIKYELPKELRTRMRRGLHVYYQGTQWLFCKLCGREKPINEFNQRSVEYNSGICLHCTKNGLQ